MRAAAANFDQLHLAAAGEVVKLRQAQALEQGQAHLLVKQVAALKRDNHLLKVCEPLAAVHTVVAVRQMLLVVRFAVLMRDSHQFKVCPCWTCSF